MMPLGFKGRDSIMTFFETLRYRSSLDYQEIGKLLPKIDLFRFFEVIISGAVMGSTIFFFTLAIDKILDYKDIIFIPCLLGLLTATIIWLQPWISVFLSVIRNREWSHWSLTQNYSLKNCVLANIIIVCLLSIGLTSPFEFETWYPQIQEQEEFVFEAKKKKVKR